MGHNFGMSHDFDDKHGGTSGACNGQGIMSYGDYLAQWSDCSVSDFTGYYENQLWGEKCLASKCIDRIIPTVLPTLTCNLTYRIFFVKAGMHTVEMSAPIVIWIQTPFAKTPIGMVDATADINRILKLIAPEHVGFAKNLHIGKWFFKFWKWM